MKVLNFLLCQLLFQAARGDIDKPSASDTRRKLTNLYHSIESPQTRQTFDKLQTLLSNPALCEHIYLDVGTNVGVQIRKLYEPHLYPNSQVLNYFKRYFGEQQNWKKVCAIGFEPNYKWTSRLNSIQSAYQRLGYPVVIFTETAANVNSQNLTFYTQPYEQEEHHEWGASLVHWSNQMHPVTTGSISLSGLLEVIHSRQGKTENSTIFMKLDVEGAEYKLIPDLLLTGAICYVDKIACEWHPHFIKGKKPPPEVMMRTLNWIMRRKENCGAQLISMDDESYGDSNLPLPT